MTLKQFLEKLKESRNKWTMLSGGVIRTRTNDHRKCKCPIEVVAGVCRGDFALGARKLGLSAITTRRIQRAADYPNWALDGDPKTVQLRAQMIEILGLGGTK